jgi:hypothetical protein
MERTPGLVNFLFESAQKSGTDLSRLTIEVVGISKLA